MFPRTLFATQSQSLRKLTLQVFCTTDQRLLSSLYGNARFRISWRRIAARAISVVSLLVANTIVFLPFALLHRLPPVALRSFFYKMYTRVLGISLRRHGAALEASHVLYVSNHVSYIDIAALMSLTGARFVSRGDIAGIPFFGWLMKSYGTVFIHRIRSDVQGQIALLRRLLDEGSPLLLFGEGTTGDGRGVLPVKSSLFAAFEQHSTHNLTLQPVSLRYSLLDGVPMGTYWEPLCAWYGKMSFLPHLWEVLSLHRITIDVYVHPPTPVAQIQPQRTSSERKALERKSPERKSPERKSPERKSPERKDIARFCREEIQKGCAQLRYGGQEEATPFLPKKWRAS